MKAIIPVAGAGTKLRPHTYTQPKALLPVAGKPIIAHLLDQLIESGFSEFVIVLGYLGEKIRDYIAHQYPSLKVSYVSQQNPDGIGHAVWLCKDFVKKNEELLIVLGDSLIDTEISALAGTSGNVLGVKKVDDPRGFGVANVEDQTNCTGRIVSLEEKPEIPVSNLALVGIYRIADSRKLFTELDELIKRNHRTHGEIQLTDALMNMISSGTIMTAFKVNSWFDCGKKEVLLETNATMLRKRKPASDQLPFYDNTIIVDPVFIAPTCRISNSIIGPNVSIGDNTVVSSSIIRDSIVGANAQLKEVLLHHSVIGSDSAISGTNHSLNIGDNTEIDLG